MPPMIVLCYYQVSLRYGSRKHRVICELTSLVKQREQQISTTFFRAWS